MVHVFQDLPLSLMLPHKNYQELGQLPNHRHVESGPMGQWLHGSPVHQLQLTIALTLRPSGRPVEPLSSALGEALRHGAGPQRLRQHVHAQRTARPNAGNRLLAAG